MQSLGVSRPRFALLAALIFLAAGLAPAEEKEKWAFAGFFELGEITDLGEEVRVPLKVRVFNYSDADVTGATITLEDLLVPDKNYGSFLGAVDVRAGESVRLSDSFTVPRRLYDEWKKDTAPQLRIEFKVADGRTARGPIALSQMSVGEEK